MKRLKQGIIFLLLSGLVLFGTKGYAINFRTNVPNNPRYDEMLFHFGFLLGVNTMDFMLKTTDNIGLPGDSLLGIKHNMLPGFSVGIVTNLRLGKYFDLRFIPTFSLGQRDLIYSFRQTDGSVLADKKSIESIFLELPLEFKWKAARLVNSRPFVTAGFKYTVDVASLTKKKKENIDIYEMKLRKHDIGFTVGVGWDFYLPYNNKIALEVKMYFGLRDLLIRENNIYTNYIDRLGSKLLQINITFE
ncbi:MAG: porin family protein [Bacteroidales bacterium]